MTNDNNNTRALRLLDRIGQVGRFNESTSEKKYQVEYGTFTYWYFLLLNNWKNFHIFLFYSYINYWQFLTPKSLQIL